MRRSNVQPMAKRTKKKRALPPPAVPCPLVWESSNWEIWIALLLAAVSFLVYLPSLRSEFVYDAHKEIIEEGFITSLSNIPSVLSFKVLGMNLMLGDRPGQLLYLMIIAEVSGKAPFAYHFCSNLLHAANVALVFILLSRFVKTAVPAPTAKSQWKVPLAISVVTLVSRCILCLSNPSLR